MIAAAGDELLSGFGVLLIALLIVFVVVVWILFPILMWIKFNELLEAQLRIHRALLAADTVREEIAKALQWMVDNSRRN